MFPLRSSTVRCPQILGTPWLHHRRRSFDLHPGRWEQSPIETVCLSQENAAVPPHSTLAAANATDGKALKDKLGNGLGGSTMANSEEHPR